MLAIFTFDSKFIPFDVNFNISMRNRSINFTLHSLSLLRGNSFQNKSCPGQVKVSDPIDMCCVHWVYGDKPYLLVFIH